jgi:hypothetical protein
MTVFLVGLVLGVLLGVGGAIFLPKLVKKGTDAVDKL